MLYKWTVRVSVLWGATKVWEATTQKVAKQTSYRGAKHCVGGWAMA